MNDPPGPAGGSPPPVEIDRLSVRLGGRVVLQDVSLCLAAGQLTAVVGPNGAGKSTLLRAVAGLLRPAAGRVRIGDRGVRGWPRRALARRLAYLPQETFTEFGVTVGDVVRLGRFPHAGILRPLRDDDRRAIDDAMERADVWQIADRPLTTLSGGERRRAFLARVVAQGSPLLVLDEPTSSLDIGHACGVLDFLSELSATGRTVLFSLHDLGLALRGPERVILLDRGRVTADGPPRDVLGSPAAARAFGVELTVSGDPPAVVPSR